MLKLKTIYFIHQEHFKQPHEHGFELNFTTFL